MKLILTAKQGKLRVTGLDPEQVAYARAHKAELLREAAIDGRVELPKRPCSLHPGAPVWVSQVAVVRCIKCSNPRLNSAEYECSRHSWDESSGSWSRQEIDVEMNEHRWNFVFNITDADREYLRKPIRPYCPWCKRVRCTDLCRALNWDTWFTCPIWKRDGLYGRPLSQLPDKRLKTLIYISGLEDASDDIKSLAEPARRILQERKDK